MNRTPDNIVVDSCEYTPVYLIQSPGVTQAGSYFLTQTNQDEHKPSDNLKSFYENSGNLENSLLSTPKPRILTKQSTSAIGNNLKLASFLLPKSEPSVVSIKPYIAPMSNVVLQPIGTTMSKNVVNDVPKLEPGSKIVRVGTIPHINTARTPFQARAASKAKPMENTKLNASKHTSVQLLKLGETYHSLSQLSDDQMKIVNKALKIFSDPEKIPKEPAYDPVTNTQFIYKVVSPRDLTVVGRNKIVMKQKKAAKKKHANKNVEKKPVKRIVPQCDDSEDEPGTPEKPRVTRSGRTVKLPKQKFSDEPSQKPRKKPGSVGTCFHCSAEFCSLYRLQRHYDLFPTHIPLKGHSNLFECLLEIIKSGPSEEQANIFIRQLELLIEKLKALLPCLMRKIDGCEGSLCNINDDICRLFGINSGDYNLNMDALNCIKDKDGHCIHKPPPKNNQFTPELKPSQLWLSKHNEEIANNEAEVEDCARINSVDKWNAKRMWKLKQKTPNSSVKRMRLTSENGEPLIELVMEDAIPETKSIDESAINVPQNKDIALLENNNKSNDNLQQVVIENKQTTSIGGQSAEQKVQFYSTHFDIRSSPIKLPSSLVRKFQINPEKMTHMEVQMLRPLALGNTNQSSQNPNCDTSMNLQDMVIDNIDVSKDNTNHALHFDTHNNWAMPENDQSHIFFESALMKEKNDNSAMELSLPHEKDKPNCLFRSESSGVIKPSLTHLQEKCKGLFEPSPIQVKSKSLIEVCENPNGVFERTLSHVKERSNSLFEPTMIHVKDKICDSFIEQGFINKKNKPNGLSEPSLILVNNNKSSDLFESALSHVRERSNGLFEHMKEKSNCLLEPSLMHLEEKSSLFEDVLTRREDDGLMESALLHGKYDIKTSAIDEHQSDQMNTDVLISSQGQSVLNFLESLGNELAYPETEIRNNSVDFQLDLFTFNTS